MTTAASDIFDLFMSEISDYKLDTIYATSGSAGLNTNLEPWLLMSITDFESICDQSLIYTTVSGTGSGDGSFSVDLTYKNKIMLALMMIKYWLKRQIQDVLEMKIFISDHDFKKNYSPANNLNAKRQYLGDVMEQIDIRLGKYELETNNWESWKIQDFD